MTDNSLTDLSELVKSFLRESSKNYLWTTIDPKNYTSGKKLLALNREQLIEVVSIATEILASAIKNGGSRSRVITWMLTKR